MRWVLPGGVETPVGSPVVAFGKVARAHLRICEFTLLYRTWGAEAREWALDLRRWTVDAGRWTLDLGRGTVDLVTGDEYE